MRVAVYTIALNELNFVERWYESAKDADYLLIADTGSVDGTQEAARRLGIHVVDVKVSPWRFDDARNAALAAIPLDIDMCISLDMDEIITPNWREPLEKAWSEGVTRPRYKHVWSWNSDGSPGLEFSYDHIHARKGYRWRHPVHECLYPYGAPEVLGWLENVETHHHPDPAKSRSQYLPLLELSVQEDPYNDRNAFYFARELYFYGMLDRAYIEFKRHLSLPTSKWPPERAASMRYLAKCNPEEAEKWLLEAIKEAPGRREALVDLAMVYYHRSDWQNCLTYAEKALEITEKPLEYLCEAGAWGETPHDIAGIAAYWLEDADRAYNHVRSALLIRPDDERLQKNLIFVEEKLQRARF